MVPLGILNYLQWCVMVHLGNGRSSLIVCLFVYRFIWHRKETETEQLPVYKRNGQSESFVKISRSTTKINIILVLSQQQIPRPTNAGQE